MERTTNDGISMADGSVDFAEQKKLVFVYTGNLKKLVDFQKQLRYYNIKRKNFFGCLIEAFMRNDERLFEVIEDYKVIENIGSKRSRKKLRKQVEELQKTANQFSVNNEDAINIFEELEEANGVQKTLSRIEYKLPE